jgi:CRP/FNR family nitrogen fixation transcriptional regulator
MSMPAAALAARQFEHRSRRPAPPAGVHAFTGTLEMMGAPISYSRNEEIYGEAEAVEHLYKVVNGAVRMYKVLADGRRQIGASTFPATCSASNLGMRMPLLPRPSAM